MIDGEGTLTATGGAGGAGIGGGNGGDGGNVTVNGGDITAVGGKDAAGIGGGSGIGGGMWADGGNIEITGGTITATGGDAVADPSRVSEDGYYLASGGDAGLAARGGRADSLHSLARSGDVHPPQEGIGTGPVKRTFIKQPPVAASMRRGLCS